MYDLKPHIAPTLQVHSITCLTLTKSMKYCELNTEKRFHCPILVFYAESDTVHNL